MMAGNFVQILLWGVLFVVLERVRRLPRGDLSLGGELCLARLRGHRHEQGMENVRRAGSGRRRPDAGHDLRRPDGDPVPADQGAAAGTGTRGVGDSLGILSGSRIRLRPAAPPPLERLPCFRSPPSP